MAEQKTKPTNADVLKFIEKAPADKKRQDALIVLDLIAGITGLEPIMWGPSIIGFGSYHYKYESGHEGDAALIGFSPRKVKMVLYVLTGFRGQEELLAKLGKHKTGKVCLYINKLDDVNLDILEEIITNAFNHMSKVHSSTSK